MDNIKKLLKLIYKESAFIKSLIVLTMLSRLLYLEDSTLALLVEIIGGLTVMIKTVNAEDLHEE